MFPGVQDSEWSGVFALPSPCPNLNPTGPYGSFRQVVSMLPPLFLGVEPHHTVLDLCAAPGSKTFQMLEVMHWPQSEGGTPPTGFILANELQWRRANMLAHQVGRLGSPCMVVAMALVAKWPKMAPVPVMSEPSGAPFQVNCDAQFFPEMSSASSDRREIFRFDRVLCDVPCSGDGTLRKTPYIWRSWTPRDGLCLHIRQLNILYRGLELLKVGGRLVYSTCSLNPIEDEAVVAAALKRHGAAVKLVPPPESMCSVQAGDGLATWVVPNPEKTGEFFEDFESAPNEVKSGKTKLLSTMYPPTGDFKEQWEQVRRYCRRLLPHLMDTGGFFIATFEKRADLAPSAKARREEKRAQLKAKEETTETAEAEAEEEKEKEPEKPKEKVVFRRLTKEYLPVDSVLPEWPEVLDFYGLDVSLSHRFVMRAEGDKSIFLVSEAAAELLRQEVKLPTRMVMCGVAAFQRTGSHHERACPWQLAQEGAAQLCALKLRRQLACSRSFLRQLLVERELTIAEVRSLAAQGDATGLEALSEADGGAFSPGSIALTLSSKDEGERPPFALVANASESSLELLLRQQEAGSLMEDLAGQPTVQEILATNQQEGLNEDDEADSGDREADDV
ncbi:unnamed protein product [Durusdinium trenchii]|uniref:SAM-dependent MTase RsmB/NOP-type domain-containing protein n=1 Tax=Durusdinium trenchii TaxID=1381693 RepID=A0ABP0N7U1_9DINO